MAIFMMLKICDANPLVVTFASGYDLEFLLLPMARGGLMDIKVWTGRTFGQTYGYPSSMTNELELRLSGEFLKHKFDNGVPNLEGIYSSYGLTFYWIFRGLRQKHY